MDATYILIVCAVIAWSLQIATGFLQMRAFNRMLQAMSLKGVVKIVVPLAVRENGGDPAIAGAGFIGIGLPADIMTDRVDAEGGVMVEDHAGQARDQESPPGIPPERGDGRRKYKTCRDGNERVETRLPADPKIPIEVFNIVVIGRLCVERLHLQPESPCTRTRATSNFASSL